MDAVLDGVFTVPGDGCIAFTPLLRTLHEAGYAGWLVVEAEQDPRKAHPLTYARLGYRNLLATAKEAGFDVPCHCEERSDEAISTRDCAVTPPIASAPTLVCGQQLFEEHTGADRLRRHHGISPERRATPKPGPHIQSYRRFLPIASLQPQRRQSRRTCLHLDARQQRLRHSLAARAIAHIHALHLGEISKQRAAAAPHRLAVQPRHEEPDMRLKDRIQIQAMPLLWRILRRQHPIELTDQCAHLIGRDRRRLDQNTLFH